MQTLPFNAENTSIDRVDEDAQTLWANMAPQSAGTPRETTACENSDVISRSWLSSRPLYPLPNENTTQAILVYDETCTIGVGAYGVIRLGLVVSREHDPITESTSKLVAVKFLSKAVLEEKGVASRAEKELQILRSVRSDHIVEFMDSGETPEEFFIVMNYCRYGNVLNSQCIPFYFSERCGHLRKRMREEHAMPIFVQMLKALRCLHGRGIIHNDVKPENILLDAEQREGSAATEIVVRLADFGDACRIGAEEDADAIYEYRGTPEFRAPEAALGLPYDEKVDIWALGLCLCEMLVGKTPFAGVTSHVEIRSIFSAYGVAALFEDDNAATSLERTDIVREFMQMEYYEDFQEAGTTGSIMSRDIVTDLIPMLCHPIPSKRLSTEQILELPIVYKYADQENTIKKTDRTDGTQNGSPEPHQTGSIMKGDKLSHDWIMLAPPISSSQQLENAVGSVQPSKFYVKPPQVRENDSSPPESSNPRWLRWFSRFRVGSGPSIARLDGEYHMTGSDIVWEHVALSGLHFD